MKRKKHRQQLPSIQDEPAGDGWAQWGSEVIMAVDETPGGAPIGVTMREFRNHNEIEDAGAGWAIAKRVLHQVVAGLGARDTSAAVGFVRFLGEGLSYKAYYAECWLPGIRDRSVELVVRLPQRDASDDLAPKAEREVYLLNHLATLALPIRIPRVIGTVPIGKGRAVVQEMVYGVPLELRASRWPGGRPWEIVAQVAALIHNIDVAGIGAIIPRHATRRAHAVAALSALVAMEIPEAADAYSWGIGHLPSDEPSCLLHGDLLGQNLRVSVDDEPPGVIDWAEVQIGDPAYDLAIVTRGKRQPFQVAGGMERLLDSYNAQAQQAVIAREVRLYELCLVAGFYRADERLYGRGSPGAENAHAQFRNLLKRIEQEAS